MALEKKKSTTDESRPVKLPKTSKIDVDEIDLGDADGSSNNLGMDNFESKAEKEKLPSEKGRIEEL